MKTVVHVIVLNKKMIKGVEKKLAILYLNGFSGYQPPGVGTDHIIPCFCKEIDLEPIIQKTGATTLQCDDWIGHEYLRCDLVDYDKIENILNCLLDMGIPFTTNTKYRVYFDPVHDKVFSTEVFEKKVIQDLGNMIDTYGFNDTMNNMNITPNVFKIWNWKTLDGKNFCEHLRQLGGKKKANPNSKHNYWNWDAFKEPLQEDKESMQKRLKDDREDCYICFDKKADTLVLPCQHSIVCKDCSKKLVATNDKDICVKCRNKITEVIE
jgi:hydroxymethylpyrimidine pyrophosphatase-like HAD family hydrolase